MLDKNNILGKILLAREDRANKQKELIKKFSNSLISFTLNIPGPIKDKELYRKVHHEGIKILEKRLEEKNLEILYRDIIHKLTGSEGYICINISGKKLKEITVEIEENHSLGRLFDFDVIDKDFKQIGRKQIGLSDRLCLLCNEKSLICRRNSKHSLKELIEAIDNISSEYFN